MYSHTYHGKIIGPKIFIHNTKPKGPPINPPIIKLLLNDIGISLKITIKLIEKPVNPIIIGIVPSQKFKPLEILNSSPPKYNSFPLTTLSDIEINKLNGSLNQNKLRKVNSQSVF